MWSVSSAVINAPESITVMAKAMKEAGSKPELEVFDSGDIQLAKQLIKDGVLKRPPLFQIVTGMRCGFETTPQTMAYARSMLPPNAIWAGFGIGRMSFPMVAQAFLLGGHGAGAQCTGAVRGDVHFFGSMLVDQPVLSRSGPGPI